MDITEANSPAQCDLCGSEAHRVRFRFHDINVVECESCGLVFVKTKEDASGTDGIYSSAYFLERDEYFTQDASGNLDGVKKEHLRDFRKGLDLLHQHKRPGRLLDVGCAVGAFLNLARSEGWEVCGVDISEFAVSRAKELFGVDAMVGELTELSLPAASFDVITMWDVVEHFPSPSRQLREARRILKDDGILLLDTPNEGALIRKASQLMYQLSGGKIVYPARKLHHIFHLYYFSERTLRQILEASGFEVVQLVTKPIPFLKGRGTVIEKSIVRVFALLEKLLGREYELLAVAKKRL